MTLSPPRLAVVSLLLEIDRILPYLRPSGRFGVSQIEFRLSVRWLSNRKRSISDQAEAHLGWREQIDPLIDTPLWRSLRDSERLVGHPEVWSATDPAPTRRYPPEIWRDPPGQNQVPPPQILQTPKCGNLVKRRAQKPK